MSEPNSRDLSSMAASQESAAYTPAAPGDGGSASTPAGDANTRPGAKAPGRVSDLRKRDRVNRKPYHESGNRRFRRNDVSGTSQRDVRALVTPEIDRASMRPNVIERNPLRRLLRAAGRNLQGRSLATAAPEHTATGASWHGTARLRRMTVFILVALQTLLATWSLSHTFPYPSLRASEMAILALFAILFSWISLGFWSAVAGFWTLLRGTKEFVAADLPVEESRRLEARIAVLMPICNEDVDRVFAGLEATYRSLARLPQFSSFDFFVLSDTGQPQKQIQEEIAWARTCDAVQGFGRIFYRHRRNNVRRKSGNIADFLRRWGRKYDYMIVFDADSVMAGETLVRLAQMMDHYPRAGIIQTAPTTINCDSFFGRMQQFAGRAYGRMLTAGQRFWQLGEGYYWGHNAIIRVAPFMRHCGLSRLPGHAPLGGEILSHDFVEAALMGRAGWEVWVVHDLPGGSYEESPPTLADELKRDRRWCQGNLQHMRVLFADRLRGGHRAILAMGIMSYASALLWFTFLILNTVELAAQAYLPAVYFSNEPSLFPVWPRWHPEWAIALLTTTAILLLLPKLLSFLLIVRNHQACMFGGVLPLLASIVLEIIVSTLLAPIRMWFHSQFVVVTLMGKQIKWGPQFRTDNETGWFDAIRLHGFASVLALAWIGGLYWLDPAITVWLLPVGVSLALAVPVSVYSSRLGLGRALRRWRLFLIPEEIVSPPVVQYLKEGISRRRERPYKETFVEVTVDPDANAVHLALLRGKSPRNPKTIERNRTLRELALEAGPAALSDADKALLLRDADSVAALHWQVPRIRDPHRAAQWGLCEFQ